MTTSPHPHPTITVLCTPGILTVVPPVEVSKPIPFYSYGVEHVAVFPQDQLLALSEVDLPSDIDWYRELVPSNTDFPWEEDRIREVGVWPYLCELGVSTERNRAIGLWELATGSGMTPVELGNWLAEHGAAATESGR